MSDKGTPASAKAALAASLLRSMMSCRGTDRISSSTRQRSTRHHALVITPSVLGPHRQCASEPGPESECHRLVALAVHSGDEGGQLHGKVWCDQVGIDVDVPERGLNGTAAVEGDDHREERDLDARCTPMHDREGGDDPGPRQLLG